MLLLVLLVVALFATSDRDLEWPLGSLVLCLGFRNGGKSGRPAWS